MANRNRALLDAVAENNEEAIVMLLSGGANPNTTDQYGNTPLYLASVYNNLPIVELLLQKGADPNAQVGRYGETILHRVIAGTSVPILELLFHYGANANRTDNDKNTPLHNAARQLHEPYIRMLLEKGVDVNVKNKNGRTPLYTLILAASQKNSTTVYKEKQLHCMRLLLKNGADVKVKDAFGKTLLHFAASSAIEPSPLCRFLVEKGVDIDAQDVNGDTALHDAAMNNNLDAVRTLVHLKADLYRRNIEGKRPSEVARGESKAVITAAERKTEARGLTEVASASMFPAYRPGKSRLPELPNNATRKIAELLGLKPSFQEWTAKMSNETIQKKKTKKEFINTRRTVRRTAVQQEHTPASVPKSRRATQRMRSQRSRKQ